MRLIVDTNIILAALIKGGIDRKIITSQNIEFYSLDYNFGEIEKYMDYIIKKSKLSKTEIETLLNLFMENIIIVSDKEVESKINEAMEIMKDVDIKDSPILACALAIPNDGIWSHDKHFEKQNKVKVWLSKDLLNHI